VLKKGDLVYVVLRDGVMVGHLERMAGVMDDGEGRWYRVVMKDITWFFVIRGLPEREVVRHATLDMLNEKCEKPWHVKKKPIKINSIEEAERLALGEML
jgi:hypothetical protein